MRPPHWQPSIELSAKEQQVVSRIRKAKLFIGTRKNLFDLRRLAVVHNLHVIARMKEYTSEQAA